MASSLNFPARWNHGSPDCGRDENPVFQIHRLDAATYCVRQNKCSSYEAPFLYLLLGDRTSLLLDSGAQPDAGGPLPLREAIDRILAESGAEHLPLRVAHTHSHGDHIHGDAILAARPGTEVVGADLESVQAAFGIDGWPDGTGSIDLGNRRLTVFPVPGHEPTHIAFYDESTRTIFSGDLLYPGLLTVRDWPAYRASAARLAAFARAHPVRHVLGCHIEMRREAGQLYPLGTTYQPDEHVLQLGPEHIEELHEVCEALGDTPRTEVRADFIVQPVT
jgi:glyoxylase-like metal-dependent hydrolase (beta-lactamase superfamily II)